MGSVTYTDPCDQIMFLRPLSAHHIHTLVFLQLKPFCSIDDLLLNLFFLGGGGVDHQYIQIISVLFNRWLFQFKFLQYSVWLSLSFTSNYWCLFHLSFSSASKAIIFYFQQIMPYFLAICNLNGSLLSSTTFFSSTDTQWSYFSFIHCLC